MNELDTAAQSQGVPVVALLIAGVVSVFYIAAMWRIFSKAGRPGWSALVPIYNYVQLAGIAGKPGWWAVLMFVPVVNAVVGIILLIELSKAFGKGGGFAAGLILLSPIFVPILAFGGAQYQGAKA
jgi:hypothetical protein